MANKPLADYIRQNHHRFHLFFVIIIATAISFGFLQLALLSNAQTGNVYYVATNGDDANSCSQAQNINTPKQTLVSGVSCLAAGDTMYIRGGVYEGNNNTIHSDRIFVPSGNSWSDPITIAGYPGETVILQRPGNFAGIKLTVGAPHYLIFQDFIIDGMNDVMGLDSNGIYVSDGSHHNRFLRLEVRNGSGNGIGVSNNNAPSPDNEIIDSKLHGNGRSDTFSNAGYGTYISGSRTLVEGNDVYNNHGYGIHINSCPSVYPGSIIRRNRVHNNVVNVCVNPPCTGGNTGGGIAIMCQDGTQIYDNLVYDNGQNGPPNSAAVGIQVYSNATNTEVYNNTVYNNFGGGIALQYYGSGTIIRNNLSSQNLVDDFMDFGGNTVVVSNNLFGVDPSFINPGAADFRLQSGSVAIDAGFALASPFNIDFDGNGRPIGSGYDIGAYEFGGVSAPTPTPTPPPSPGNNAIYISQSVPSTMAPGQTYPVSVTMQNTGTTTWFSAQGYSLGSQNPQDNLTWGVVRASTPNSVFPGSQATFNFNVIAPQVAGIYNFQWQMLRESVEWFGGYTPNLVIDVTSTAITPTPPPPSSNPCIINSVSWGAGSYYVGDISSMNVVVANPADCFNNTIQLAMYEEDPLNFDDGLLGPVVRIFNQSTNTLTYTYQLTPQDYINGGNESGNESIYFIAQVQGQSATIRSAQVNFYNTASPTPTPTPVITPTPTPPSTPTPTPVITPTPTPTPVITPTPTPTTTPTPTSAPGPQSTCTLTSVNWVFGGGSIHPGETAGLRAIGSNCEGLTVSFDIYEWDPARNDYIATDQGIFSNNVALACHAFTSGDFVSGGNEFVGENIFFTAKVFASGSSTPLITMNSPQIIFLDTAGSGTNFCNTNGGGGGQPLPPAQSGENRIITWRLINPLAGLGGGSPPNDIFGVILLISNWILNIAGSLIILLIIYSGVRFVISRGNPGEIQAAKNILKWALVGFAVVLIGKGFIFLIDSVLRGNIPTFP